MRAGAMILLGLSGCSLVFDPSAHQRNRDRDVGADDTLDVGATEDAGNPDAPSADAGALDAASDASRDAAIIGPDVSGPIAVHVRVVAGPVGVAGQRVVVSSPDGMTVSTETTSPSGELDVTVQPGGAISFERSFFDGAPVTYFGLERAALGGTPVLLTHRLRPEAAGGRAPVRLPSRTGGDTLLVVTGCELRAVPDAATTMTDVGVGPQCAESHTPPYRVVVARQSASREITGAWTGWSDGTTPLDVVTTDLGSATLAYTGPPATVLLQREVIVGGAMTQIASESASTARLAIPTFPAGTTGEDVFTVGPPDSQRLHRASWTGAGDRDRTLGEADLLPEAPIPSVAGGSVRWESYTTPHDYVLLSTSDWHAIMPEGTTSVARPDLPFPGSGGAPRVQFVERSDFDEYSDVLERLAPPDTAGVTIREAHRRAP